jgi:PA14 domain
MEKPAPLAEAKKLELDASVEQGLPVHFRYSFYRHIDNMPLDEDMTDEGKSGKTVAFLNHQFKESVFDSGSEKGVGVFLKGYLKMNVAGSYQFKAMSNDGIRVMVDNEVVVLDPTVHSDRFSPVGQMNIDDPGWYPLTVKYFQRKGTARLELYWQPPGKDTFEIIPAAAYGHVE